MELGKLTEKQKEAAALVARGKKKTIEEIANICGVSPRTIDYWKTDKDFQAEVMRIKNLWRETVRVTGIADPELRLHVLHDLKSRILGVINARAKDPEMQAITGGKTGMIVKTLKMRSIGQGEQVAEWEYAVDHALINDILALDRSARIELDALKSDAPGAADDVAGKIIDRLNEARRRAAAAKRRRESPIELQPAIETTESTPPE